METKGVACGRRRRTEGFNFFDIPCLSLIELRVAGIPILLGDNPDRRPQESQEHADTGSSIWDGAVALAKASDSHVWETMVN